MGTGTQAGIGRWAHAGKILLYPEASAREAVRARGQVVRARRFFSPCMARTDRRAQEAATDRGLRSQAAAQV